MNPTDSSNGSAQAVSTLRWGGTVTVLDTTLGEDVRLRLFGTVDIRTASAEPMDAIGPYVVQAVQRALVARGGSVLAFTQHLEEIARAADFELAPFLEQLAASGHITIAQLVFDPEQMERLQAAAVAAALASRSSSGPR